MTEEIALPGGRLTRQERRQIALGPADSLPYAEFARCLGRPTSTVAREVMRNGGPTTYRADLAHRATERRARRRRPASSRGPESLPQPHGGDAEAMAVAAQGAAQRGEEDVAYEERFSGVLMASGLTRMAARMLICSVHHRRGQPHRVPTRPASPGHSGVRLQGDRLPGEPEPRPPATRRTPPRPPRRRRRTLPPDDDRRRPIQRPARRNRTPKRPRPRPPHPRRHPPREHRPLPRIHRRRHHPRRRAGPRSPPHQSRNNLERHRPTRSGPRVAGRLGRHSHETEAGCVPGESRVPGETREGFTGVRPPILRQLGPMDARHRFSFR